MTPDQTAAANLKALRTSRGLTLEQLGNQIGIARQNLSGIETGRVVRSLDWWVKLAEKLQVTPGSLHPLLTQTPPQGK